MTKYVCLNCLICIKQQCRPDPFSMEKAKILSTFCHAVFPGQLSFNIFFRLMLFIYFLCHTLTSHPFTNDHLAQVLRNAGSKVKLLIARDVTKDNHLSSPVLSQDSLDGKVCVYAHMCVYVHVYKIKSQTLNEYITL